LAKARIESFCTSSAIIKKNKIIDAVACVTMHRIRRDIAVFIMPHCTFQRERALGQKRYLKRPFVFTATVVPVLQCRTQGVIVHNGRSLGGVGRGCVYRVRTSYSQPCEPKKYSFVTNAPVAGVELPQQSVQSCRTRQSQ